MVHCHDYSGRQLLEHPAHFVFVMFYMMQSFFYSSSVSFAFEHCAFQHCAFVAVRGLFSLHGQVRNETQCMLYVSVKARKCHASEIDHSIWAHAYFVHAGGTFLFRLERASKRTLSVQYPLTTQAMEAAVVSTP